MTQSSTLGAATTNSPVLSAADVARLAGVRRPVVSTWRRRYAGSEREFPAPIRVVGDAPVFSADEVTDWLSATGLGNNISARADVATFVPLPDVPDAFVTYSALLAISALGYTNTDTVEGLERVARDADAPDLMVSRELRGIDPNVIGLLADDAAARSEASWGAGSALEALVRSRHRSAPAAFTVGHLGADGALVLADVIRGIASAVGAPRVVDATGHLDDIALALVDESSSLAVDVHGDHPVARLTRRRLMVRDHVDSAAVVGRRASKPMVVWHMPPEQIEVGHLLADFSEALVDQPPGATLVAIGPSSVLLDGLREPAAALVRGDLVRDPRFRCAIRLPRGIVTARPRQHLAVLIFTTHISTQASEEETSDGGSRQVAVERPDLVRTIDLDGVPLDAAVRRHLTDDVVASVSPSAAARAHAFTYGSWARRSEVLARAGALLPSMDTAARAALSKPAPEANADVALVIARQAESLGHRVLEIVRHVEPTSEFVSRPRLMLGSLAEDGVLRMYPGARIHADDVGDNGVPVISEFDVRRGDPVTGRAVPVLVQQGLYGRAILTAPNDVIVTTQPAAAWIDRRGRSLVEAPARILRLVDGARVGLTPELVAAAVNTESSGVSDWRRWAVSPAQADERHHLGAALGVLHDRRLELRRQLEDLESIARSLTEGVRDRTLRFSSSTPEHDLEGGA